MLISFSKFLNEYLEKNNKLLDKKILDISSAKKGFSVTKGKVKISVREIDYFQLPHPNYPITGEAREKAWDFCFKKMK